MFRPRVRLKTGCRRCRIRKKKCDEARPRCGYCAKWNLDCFYDLRDDRKKLIKSNYESSADDGSVLEKPPSPESHFTTVYKLPKAIAASSMDAFYSLPIPDARQRPEILHELCLFFVRMVNTATPFNIQLTRQTLTQEWFESMFSEPAVCCAFLSYIAAQNAETTQSNSMRLFSLEFENRTIQLIQAKLDCGSFADNNVLLAISVHLTSSAVMNRPMSNLASLSNGIRCIIDMRGGFKRVSTELSLSNLVSLSKTDEIVALPIGLDPVADVIRVPTVPHTLRRYLEPVNHSSTHQLSREILELLQNIKFISKFRAPASVNRALNTIESSYIFTLLLWIDTELHRFQRKYLGTGDELEIIALALAFYKKVILSGASQPGSTVPALLSRLRLAFKKYLGARTALDKNLNSVMIWSCFIAGAVKGFPSKTAFFQNNLRSRGISARDILACAECLPWHSNLNSALQCYDDDENPGSLIS